MGWRARKSSGQDKRPDLSGSSGAAGREHKVDDSEKQKAAHAVGIDADVVMGDADGDDAGDGADQALGIKCSRCSKRGHTSAGCTTELYCVICDGRDHVNHRCPVLKQPKPVAHAVGYAVHGLGFYHIPHPPLSRTRKESRSASITVVGGELTKEQVVIQLQRIFPSKWA